MTSSATPASPVVYQPVGRLDGTNAAAVEKELLALMADNGYAVRIDLAALDYVSSAGLRVLLVGAKTAKAKGGKLVLASPQPSILEVLKISGFDKIFEIQA